MIGLFLDNSQTLHLCTTFYPVERSNKNQKEGRSYKEVTTHNHKSAVKFPRKHETPMNALLWMERNIQTHTY